jgi:hypothetical protein
MARPTIVIATAVSAFAPHNISPATMLPSIAPMLPTVGTKPPTIVIAVMVADCWIDSGKPNAAATTIWRAFVSTCASVA